MSKRDNKQSMDRRDFMKTSAVAAAAGAALTATATQAADDVGLDRRNERPDRMAYTVLGNTNFNCSRLVFGCGAALAGGKAVRLLERAFDQGVNHYDVGFDTYYKGSEAALAPFIAKHKGDVWVVSKAPAAVRLQSGAPFNAEAAKQGAEYWLRELDKSLSRLKTDYVDAYYLMGIDNPELVKSEEVGNAFMKAKAAGKVGFFGFSSHKNVGPLLEAAIPTGWYSSAMIGVTPAGYYDWDSKSIAQGTPTLKKLRPLFDRAREAGIGLVGMKAARFISTPLSLGKGDTTAFDSHYTKEQMEAPVSPFQRSYMYCLQNGLDVMNSDMQNFKHFEENVVAARDSAKYFA